MENAPLLKYITKRIGKNAMNLETAELVMIKEAILSQGKKKCGYCKWSGHTINLCPVRIGIAERCHGDGLRDKIRGRISNNLRLAERLPLETVLGKRKRNNFGWALEISLFSPIVISLDMCMKI